MLARDFVYWFQGFLEIAKPETISKEQLTMIRQHMDMVFITEIDPSFGGPETQEALNNAHQGSISRPWVSTRPGRGNVQVKC